MNMKLSVLILFVSVVAWAVELPESYDLSVLDHSLDMGRFQSPVPGAKALDLNIGIGSGAFHSANDPQDIYFTITDRGPNFACKEAPSVMDVDALTACPASGKAKEGSGRIFTTPDYNVSIFEVRLDRTAKTFATVRRIALKTKHRLPVRGLANPLTRAGAEIARDGSGTPLPPDVNAIDAEAMVRLADGRFFVGEENAPSILEVAADGTVLRRFVPAGAESDFAGADYEVIGSLPEILSKRTGNRGIESLALIDEHTLLAGMQSPLSNPNAAAFESSRNTRLFKLTIGSSSDGATTLNTVAEYVYRMEDFDSFTAAGAEDASGPSSLKVSEILSLGGGRFAVDERTDQVAKIFEIDLKGATNILGGSWDSLNVSPSLEETDELWVQGIRPVTKVEKLTASSAPGAAPVYPAKIEGMALTPAGDLLLINDNDFGILGAATRIVTVKGTGIGPH